jgi:hypothetical protein
MTAPVVSMTQWGGFEDGGQNEQGNPPAEPNVLRHLHFSKGNSFVVKTHCRLMYPLHLSPLRISTWIGYYATVSPAR